MNRNASPATKEEVIGKELARIAKERAKAMEHVGEQVKRTIAFLQENEGKIGAFCLVAIAAHEQVFFDPKDGDATEGVHVRAESDSFLGHTLTASMESHKDKSGLSNSEPDLDGLLASLLRG